MNRASFGLIGVLALVVGPVACAAQGAGGKDERARRDRPIREGGCVATRPAADREVEPAEAPAVDLNAFAYDLYGRLQGMKKFDGQNIFLSPYSVSTALAMAAAGARGETAGQMADVLHLGADRQRAHEAYRRTIEQINAAGEQGDYQLSVANALWMQQGYEFHKQYLTLVERYYHAALRHVDYREATEQARQTINQWVEKQTRDKIKDLLPAGSLGPQVRLVLTNAIYFKGMWSLPFEPEKTEEQVFTKLSGEKVPVPMMRQQETFRYAETDSVQILELPYAGASLVMDIILPKEKTDLLQVEQSLTDAQVRKWLGQLAKREVLVTLPKFKMTVDVRMSEVLSAMGMPLAFSGDADFSGMTGREQLCISEVYHKAFVEVNEEGTEAAAATGLVMRATAMPVQPAEFRADRPFHFMIRDAGTGTVLFMGRVMDPK